MASEQMPRRENTTIEREIHFGKDRVPNMTTHFENLAVQEKEPPQWSIEALQGGEINKEHAGKAIGDVGGRGKASETHELGAHFESLADKVKGEEDRKEKESNRAANNVVVGDKKGEAAATREREGFGGVCGVGKLEMKGAEGKESLGDEERLDKGRNKDREELERRTRVVTGTTVPENKERKREIGKGQVVAEKAKGKEEEEQLRGRVGADNEGAKVVASGKEEGARDEEKLRGRAGAENEGAIWGKGERGREEGSERSSTLDEISKYRNQAQQSANEAISAAQERYERAKEAANETLSNTTQSAQEKSATAKDIAMEKTSQATEKGQQGYAAAKDTISSAAKTAADYTAPVAEKAKTAGGSTVSYVGEKAVQAKDATVEGGKTAAGYAGKLAVDLKDKATVAGWTAANYSTEKTVQGTKAAANVVEGAAGYAGHKAAELAAKSVDAVKGLAASAGETAKGYTARKKEDAKLEYEAKKAAQYQEGEEKPSQGIDETVSNYAQKLKPSGGSPQEGQDQAQGTDQEGKGNSVLSAIGETVGNVGEKVKKPFEKLTGDDQSSGQAQGKGSEAMTTTIGEKLGDAAQKMKKPLDNITEGGSEVLGSVGETVGEIGENMIKPADKVQEQRLEGKEGGGVLDAIGETIAEIAQTTKVIVAGEGDKESSQNSIGSESHSTDRDKLEGDQAAQRV